MEEPVAGPEGGEKGVAGKKGAKRPEHLANRVKRKAPNGGFGQGIVVCGGIHWETPQREKYLSCPLCQGNSLGNSCSGLCLGLLRGQVYSKTRMRPSSSGTSGAFHASKDARLEDTRRKRQRAAHCIIGIGAHRVPLQAISFPSPPCIGSVLAW